MNPQKFKADYLHVLHFDTKKKEYYIKLPIEDLKELSYFHESLLNNILLLNRLEQQQYKLEQKQSIIYWLCKILSESYPYDELYGLTEYLNQ